MSIDPGDPETFADDEPDDFGQDLGSEVPEADAAEQHADLVPDQDDPLASIDVDGIDPADAVDQARVAGFDDDERG